MSQDAAAADRIFVLERIDPARRMARVYVLAIEPTLFDAVALTREWGRLGARPRRRIELHRDERAAQVELDRWLRIRKRRGYVERA
jgi:predicted DNA-binding WGR domain protein